MERQLTGVGRDIGLASALLLVIGAYVASYIWVFGKSTTLGAILAAAHTVIVAAVLVTGIRRSRARDLTVESPAMADLFIDDAIPSFVSHRSDDPGVLGMSQHQSGAGACTVTDLAAVRHQRSRTVLSAGEH